MMYYSKVTPFLLITFIAVIESRMALVSECPKNKMEVAKASQKIGCGVDKYGNIQFLCLPNKEKTSLVELCIDRVMGIQDKGNCLEVFEGKVIKHNCNNFSSGCPEKHFYEYEFFENPACQNINTEFHCYFADPVCPAIPSTEESSNYITIISISVGFFIFVVIIGIIVGYLWRRKKSKREEDVAEIQPLSNESPLQITQSSPACKDTSRFIKGKAELKIRTNPNSRITNSSLCFHCTNPIRGDKVEVQGKTWCPEHFKCQYKGCGRNLVDIGFYEKDGVFYCEKDYEQHIALICNMCRKPIKDSRECVTVQQKTYHRSCLNCYKCKNPLSGSGFQLKDGNFYCENHIPKTLCQGCKKIINPTDECLTAMGGGGVYHIKCFTCSACGANLATTLHHQRGGKPYCKMCQ